MIRRIRMAFSARAVAACLLLVAVVASAGPFLKARGIQIGYCARLNEIDAAKAAGFDYVELRTSEIAALSDDEFEKLRAKLRRLELPAPVTYLFIPGSIKLTGPGIDKRQQMDYVTRAFDRVSRLGASVITFGSGAARQIPDGFSKQEAFNNDYGPFFENLKKIGYEGRISVETGAPDVSTNARQSIAFLRAAFSR